MRPGRPAAFPLTVRIQDAMEQAEAGHAAADQVRMVPDVATMFDEMKVLAGLGQFRRQTAVTAV